MNMCIQSFNVGNVRYKRGERVGQTVNDYRGRAKQVNGRQWQCDYPDGSSAFTIVWRARYTRQDVVDAIDDVNEQAAEREQETQDTLVSDALNFFSFFSGN